MASSRENLEPFPEASSLDEFDPAEVRRVAAKAFFGLMEKWGLTREQGIILLGKPSERTYYRWREGQVSGLSHDTLERISVMLGIYKATHVLLPVAARADGYLKRPNTAFGGESALDVMLKGRIDNLYQVRRHLDAWRG
ncbi:MAG: MbcA/ParS/Xre antitoxin family protein [bacterium]|nr:MbcA/ParS/Xre antitoxin family protein [bacterium]